MVIYVLSIDNTDMYMDMYIVYICRYIYVDIYRYIEATTCRLKTKKWDSKNETPFTFTNAQKFDFGIL